MHPKGFEPLSLVPETNILSIELRVPEAAKVKNPVNHFAGYTLLHSLSFIHEKYQSVPKFQEEYVICTILMKFSLYIFSILFLSVSALAQQQVGTGEWNVHLPYNRGNSVCEGDGVIYVGCGSGVYSVDMDTKELNLLSTVNGLSDINVTSVGYSDQASALIIAYANGNLDILKDGQVVNLQDILIASSINQKRVNHITIRGTMAYLACDFGIATVDLVKEEIPSYVIFLDANGLEMEVYDVEFTNDGQMLAAADEGLYYYDGNGALQDFGAWQVYDEIFQGTYNSVVNHNGTIYACYSRKLSNGFDNQDTIYTFNGSTWQVWDTIIGQTVRSLDVQNGKLSILLAPEVGFNGTLIVKNADGTDHARLSDGFLYLGIRAFTDSKGITWVAEGSYGVISVFDYDKRNFYVPDGPFSSASYHLSHTGNTLWVAGGGMSLSFGPLFNVDGVFKLRKGSKWSYFNTLSKPLMSNAADFLQVIPHVSDTGRVFAVSNGAGVFEIVGNSVVAKFDSSTTNGAISKSVSGLHNTTSASMDGNGALWVSLTANSRPLAVRDPDGVWKSFFVPGASSAQVNYVKALSNGDVWISVRGVGIVAIRHDDYNSISQVRTISTNSGSGALPSPFVNVIVEDQDGEVWVGTENGFIIFYNPSAVFGNSGFNGVQPVVVASDGNNEKLLDGVFVKSIAVDGGNRKWMATYGAGAYLISEDGYTIKQHFLKAATPLISDNLISVCVDPDEGNVFFGSDLGIVSYRGDATEASNIFSENIYAFPNPVRPEFTGPITITGMARDSYIKITDVSGQLIFQTRSNGGTAIWNGNSFDGRRAKTGVYIVFAANEDGSEREVTRILVVN